MASRRDMQDIMGLPSTTTTGAPKPPAPKRPKAPGLTGKRMTGISREVVALMGERPPPVAIYDEKNMYKSRRHTGPAKKWAQTPFYNPARRDGLILQHWRRKQPIIRTGPDEPDVMMEDLDIHGPIQIQSDYEFAKYNVQVDVPEYTDEQYEAHLQSEDWSKEETDYLFELVKDYSYRWPAIWDRYEFEPAATTEQPADDSGTAAIPKKTRSMEELKARFYSVQAVIMKLKTSIPTMTPAEFSLHETLSNYNIKTETDRKALATALLTRTKEDVVEEEFLLVELQRICASMERLEAERDDIRLTHDYVRSTASPGEYQTFASLNTLFQHLFAQDKNKKRQGTSAGGRLSINTSDLTNPNGAPNNHRDSLASAATTTTTSTAHPNKKGSAAAAAAHHQPIRHLAPAQERRFGVSTHDRLQSGVVFRSDKLSKLRQAKSQAQTNKLLAALAELGIPDTTLMCSAPTVAAFERLVQRVAGLLEARKAREKEDAEMKTVAHMLAARRREVAGEKGEVPEGADESEIRDGGGSASAGAGAGASVGAGAGAGAGLRGGEDGAGDEEEDDEEDEDDEDEDANKDDANASSRSDDDDDDDDEDDNDDEDDTQDQDQDRTLAEDSELPDMDDAAGSDASNDPDPDPDNDNDHTVDLDDDDDDDDTSDVVSHNPNNHSDNDNDNSDDDEEDQDEDAYGDTDMAGTTRPSSVVGNGGGGGGGGLDMTSNSSSARQGQGHGHAQGVDKGVGQAGQAGQAAQAGHKRSASVLSATSRSSKASKRTRK